MTFRILFIPFLCISLISAAASAWSFFVVRLCAAAICYSLTSSSPKCCLYLCLLTPVLTAAAFMSQNVILYCHKSNKEAQYGKDFILPLQVSNLALLQWLHYLHKPLTSHPPASFTRPAWQCYTVLDTNSKGEFIMTGFVLAFRFPMVS